MFSGEEGVQSSAGVDAQVRGLKLRASKAFKWPRRPRGGRATSRRHADGREATQSLEQGRRGLVRLPKHPEQEEKARRPDRDCRNGQHLWETYEENQSPWRVGNIGNSNENGRGKLEDLKWWENTWERGENQRRKRRNDQATKTEGKKPKEPQNFHINTRDQEDNFYDEEDYDPGLYDKHEGTIDEEVENSFLIIPHTQYYGYHDVDEGEVDKNGEAFGKEYYSDKNLDEYPNDEIGDKLEGREDYSEDKDTRDKQIEQEYEGNKEGDDSEYKELYEELDIGDDEGFNTGNKYETNRIFVLVEDDSSYEETSPKGRGNIPYQ
eukprot:Gb_30796 [translate_table: standard]